MIQRHHFIDAHILYIYVYFMFVAVLQPFSLRSSIVAEQ